MWVSSELGYVVKALRVGRVTSSVGRIAVVYLSSFQCLHKARKEVLSTEGGMLEFLEALC